ncbi:MAG: hypothetical protein BJ554DRAFT_288 [Olpidium bornovanus]|uniref:Uncharacterized protein n=1 Tax=Olpidium bornovanus TaxID=278681 RepID=A0A8H8DIA5_9FUNG|nr:MAG: hypothetical protein BJ554DRAFT_288 [Olpidium bornovanus]
MVYKYWDSITREDLEFAVASGGKSWEAREDAGPAGEMRPGDALYFDGPASPALSLVVGARTAASSLYAPDLPFAPPATSSVYAPDLPFALPAAEPRGIAVPARYRGPGPFPAPFWGSDWRQSAAIFGPAAPGGGAPPVVPVGLRPIRRSVSADSLPPPLYHRPDQRYARNPSLQIPAYALLFSAHPGGRRPVSGRQTAAAAAAAAAAAEHKQPGEGAAAVASAGRLAAEFPSTHFLSKPRLRKYAHGDFISLGRTTKKKKKKKHKKNKNLPKKRKNFLGGRGARTKETRGKVHARLARKRVTCGNFPYPDGW